ncbi:MAG: T9SS type A sorting domain-containing protein, partial [Sphingobacteriales bacterium]
MFCMKKNFTQSLSKLVCFLFVLGPFFSYAQPATGTTGFDGNVGVLSGTGLSPQTATLQGFRFTLYSGNSAQISNTSSQVNLTSSPEPSGVWQFASIETSDGSDMKLQNFTFRVLSPSFVGKNLAVIGYRDGLAVSGAFTITQVITAINTSYNVDVTSVAGFYNVDEFRIQPSAFNTYGTLAIEDITVDVPLILPVRWLGFDVKQAKGEHQLQWSTTEEINHAYFEVEQSSNAKDFKTIGRISGAASQVGAMHHWNFNYPAGKGVYFYRIRQVDRDGRFQYSGTRKIGEVAAASITVYPNPVVNELRISGVAAGTKLQVLDGSGRIVSQHVLTSRSAINLAGLPAGRYGVLFQMPAGKQVTWIYKN